MSGALAKVKARVADLRSSSWNPRSYSKRGKPSPNAHHLKSTHSNESSDHSEFNSRKQDFETELKQPKTADLKEKGKMMSPMPPKKSFKSKMKAAATRVLSALNGEYPYNMS